MKPKRNWKDHPELVNLRKRRSKRDLLALVAEVTAERLEGPKKKVVPRQIEIEVPRKMANPEYYYKMYFKNEFKPILGAIR